MANKKPSALEALAKVKNERAALESRAADLKRAAALEVGMIVLDAGGGELGPEKLRSLVSRARALGGEASLKLLSGNSNPASIATAVAVEEAVAKEASNG